MTNIETRVLRAGDGAVADLLVRALIVPQVFFDALWPDMHTHADIVAIDRAGAGDVHVVEIAERFDKATGAVIRRLLEKPAHFRWLAVPNGRINEHLIENLAGKLSKHGIGLIGVAASATGGVAARSLSKAVRAGTFNREIIGDFLARSVPDIEFGEAPHSADNGVSDLLSKPKIAKYLNEAEELLKLNHARAAFLLAWSAAEAAMKLLLDPSERGKLRSPNSLVRAIRETGKLTASEANAVDNALGVRNMLVHGLDEPRDLRQTVRSLTAIARKLLNLKMRLLFPFG